MIHQAMITAWFACALTASCAVPAPIADARAELARRVPPLAETSDIEISKDASDSFAYLIVHSSGQLTYVPFRTQSITVPVSRRTTRYAVVEFAAVYGRIARSVALEKTSPLDHLVYFSARNAGSSTAVFFPAAQSSFIQSLFDAAASAEQTVDQPN
jgi:hypothetical protein